MTRYRVATPTNKGLTSADKFGFPEVNSPDAVADMLRPFDFDGCSVWRYDGRARHWGLIFDTSLPDACRLPASLYWCNVAQNERGVK